jgi:hypothetical protein
MFMREAASAAARGGFPSCPSIYLKQFLVHYQNLVGPEGSVNGQIDTIPQLFMCLSSQFPTNTQRSFLHGILSLVRLRPEKWF